MRDSDEDARNYSGDCALKEERKQKGGREGREGGEEGWRGKGAQEGGVR